MEGTRVSCSCTRFLFAYLLCLLAYGREVIGKIPRDRKLLWWKWQQIEYFGSETEHTGRSL